MLHPLSSSNGSLPFSVGPYRSIGRARVELAIGRHGTALRELHRIAGATLTSRQLAEALAIECAALMKIPGSPRMPGLIDQLDSPLERTVSVSRSHNQTRCTAEPTRDRSSPRSRHHYFLGPSSRDEALAIAWDRHLLVEDDE